MDEFTAKQLELNLSDPPTKPIYIKLSPGTELFNRVVMCSEHLETTPTKAGRILLRAGWLGFVKSVIMDLKRKAK